MVPFFLSHEEHVILIIRQLHHIPSQQLYILLFANGCFLIYEAEHFLDLCQYNEILNREQKLEHIIYHVHLEILIVQILMVVFTNVYKIHFGMMDQIVVMVTEQLQVILVQLLIL